MGRESTAPGRSNEERLAREIAHGKKPSQAAAIAYSKAGKSRKGHKKK